MKQDLSRNAQMKWSGTGGFELFCRTTLPLLADISTREGKKEYGLESTLSDDRTTTVCIKLMEGDDASCFNLNRSLSPTVLGIDHRQMSKMGAFKPRKGKADPWQLLDQPQPDNTLPCLAGDLNTAQYGLQLKKLGPVNGETLTIRDEQGNERTLRVVGALPVKLSILQGNILVSRETFSELYPSRSGYNMMLVDCPEEEIEAVSGILNRKLKRNGADIVSSVTRLADFYLVESAYLSMFLVLGGLGILLGTAGLGVLLARNTLERRKEIALMRSIGFSAIRVEQLVASEYMFLIIAGMLSGLISSATAIWPNLNNAAVDVPWVTMAALAAGMLLSAAAFIYIALKLSTGNSLINSLREE